MNSRVEELYNEWLSQDLKDPDLVSDLQSKDEEEINDSFYRDLEFGTAGLRGVLGAGTNRMNIYTVGRATRGFARYLCTLNADPSMAIAYDSRHKSDVFARETARIMAEYGVHVYLWPELMPTPALSFAVRYYHCDGGVVITASHNPARYNGYKAYDSTGCQIDSEAAAAVLGFISEEPMFRDDDFTFEEGIKRGLIEYIPEDTCDRFIDACGEWSYLAGDIDKTVRIAYTPLHGAGLKSVTKCLERNGFNNIVIVKEQAEPDGDFPTCPYPNPEIREAMETGLKAAKENGADILIATDPDADRIGIAVRDGDDYSLITGNQVGMMLFEWICKRRTALGRMPEDPIVIKTIVTTDIIYKIAKEYGAEVKDTLTGFKNIAPIVSELAEKNETDRYLLGFEESYGYMCGSHVRDKDSVSAALMIASMFAWYKERGISLKEVLDGIYEKYGYYLNTTHSYEFPGESGFEKMRSIMEYYRKNPLKEIAGIKVAEVQDYEHGYKGIPASNVIKYILEGEGMAVLRPSGTEPKLKLYIGVSAADKQTAESLEKAVEKEMAIGLK